jgi:hypothetical protein
MCLAQASSQDQASDERRTTPAREGGRSAMVSAFPRQRERSVRGAAGLGLQSDVRTRHLCGESERGFGGVRSQRKSGLSARARGRFERFGVQPVRCTTEQQEGNGCGDVARLPARGILRGV